MGLARYEIPKAGAGLKIGLFGGSFDPPHAGHLHVAREALKRFDLDQVWLLISPANPLKPHGPAPIAARMAATRALIDHPRLKATDIEARLGQTYTARTLAQLLPLYPQVRFVWLMGADNFAQFHRWQDWQAIIETLPLGILARPGQRISACLGRAARAYGRYRLPLEAAGLLAVTPAPAWCFVNLPMRNLSSSAIRAAGAWQVQAV